MSKLLARTLAKESAEYNVGNMEKIGPKTFVSPNLLAKIEVEAKIFYELK